MRGQALQKHKRRRDKKLESNIDSDAHIKPLNNKNK
jgi:hypothetical protein